jgi:tetratricopeptide (TPR) repeat protein
MSERAVRMLVQADRARDLTVRHQLAEEAGNLLQQAIVIGRGQSLVRPGALAALGGARGLLDDFEGAIALYQQAIAINPSEAFFHCNLGAMLQQRGDNQSALVSLHKAVSISGSGNTPFASVCHSNLGAALGNAGDVKGAISAHQRAITIDSQNANAHSNLANDLWKIACATGQEHQFIAAMVPAKRAIALHYHNAQSHNTLGSCLRNTGDPQGAAESFQRAISIDPVHPGIHYNLGNALSDCGDAKGAIAAYQQAIIVTPPGENQKVGQIHCNLGSLLHAKGDLKGAMASLQLATSIYPNDEKAHLFLGHVLSDMAGYDESISLKAVSSYERAFALDTSSSFGANEHIGFACALEAVGRDEAALVYWKSNLPNCSPGSSTLQRMRACEDRIAANASMPEEDRRTGEMIHEMDQTFPGFLDQPKWSRALRQLEPYGLEQKHEHKYHGPTRDPEGEGVQVETAVGSNSPSAAAGMNGSPRPIAGSPQVKSEAPVFDKIICVVLQ